MSKLNKNIWELEIYPQSAWVTPLTADTIFGHLCWKLLSEFPNGGSDLDKFLELMSIAPIFTLSDVLPKGYIYRPILTSDNEIDKKSSFGNEIDKIKEFTRSMFVTNEKLINYSVLLENQNNEEIFARGRSTFLNNCLPLTKVYKQSLRIKNVIDRESGVTGKNGVYSQKEQTLQPKKTNRSNVTSLTLLVKFFDKGIYKEIIDKEPNKIFSNYESILNFLTEDKLRDFLKEVITDGYGKKKSVGYGAFNTANDWIRQEQWSKTSGNTIVALSSFVPQENDSTEGMYSFFVKYGKLGETRSMEGNHHKKPLLMVKPGSTFKKNDKYKGYLGRMVGGLSDQYKDVVHYGYGMTLEF